LPRYSPFVLSEKVYPRVFVFQKSYGLSYQINRFLPLAALVQLRNEVTKQIMRGILGALKK